MEPSASKQNETIKHLGNIKNTDGGLTSETNEAGEVAEVRGRDLSLIHTVEEEKQT